MSWRHILGNSNHAIVCRYKIGHALKLLMEISVVLGVARLSYLGNTCAIINELLAKLILHNTMYVFQFCDSFTTYITVWGVIYYTQSVLYIFAVNVFWRAIVVFLRMFTHIKFAYIKCFCFICCTWFFHLKGFCLHIPCSMLQCWCRRDNKYEQNNQSRRRAIRSSMSRSSEDKTSREF